MATNRKYSLQNYTVPRQFSDGMSVAGAPSDPSTTPATPTAPSVSMLSSPGYSGGNYNTAPIPAVTGDPNKMYRADRGYLYQQGSNLDQDLSGAEQSQRNAEGYYRNQADTAYSDLANNPGYTPSEQNNILRTSDYQNLIQPMSLKDNTGGTDTYGQYFNPQSLTGAVSDSAQLQRGDVANATDASNAAANNFGTTSTNALSTGGQNVRGSIDYSKLALDPNFQNNYQMSDADVQGYVDQAGRNVQNQTASAMGNEERAAAASGASTPLALAAAQARLQNQGAAAQADAMTDARLAAKQQQAQRLQTGEGMRLGAEQNYAGLRSSNEQQLLGQQLGAIGQQAGMSQRAAEYGGNLGTGVEQGLLNQNIGAQQYNTNTGTAINEAAQQNRFNQGFEQQNQNMQNQQNQFNQGFAVQNQMSNLYGNVANARRQDQGEYRNYLSGQGQNYLQAGQQTAGQRIQGYGTQGSLVNQNTAGYGNRKTQEGGFLGSLTRAGQAAGAWTGAFSKLAGGQ